MTTFPSTDAMSDTMSRTISDTASDGTTCLPTDCPLVAVLVGVNESHLVAATSISKGTHLFTLNGVETASPTRYSVQLSHATGTLKPRCGATVSPDGQRISAAT